MTEILAILFAVGLIAGTAAWGTYVLWRQARPDLRRLMSGIGRRQ